MKLRSKFIVTLIGVGVIPLGLSMQGIIQNVEKIQRDTTLALNLQSAQSAAKEIEAFLLLQFGVLENFAAFYTEFSRDPSLREEVIEPILFRSREFVDLAVVDQDGKELARKNTLQVITKEDLVDRSQQPDFRFVREHDFFVGPVYLSGGKPYFDIGSSDRDIGEKFRGAFFGQIDARSLQDVVKNVASSRKATEAYLVNEKGKVIAHQDISQVLLSRDFSDIAGVRVLTEEAGGDLLVSVYANREGKEVLGGGVPVKISFPEGKVVDTGWFVLVEQPSDVALAGVNQVRRFSVGVLAGVLLIVLGVTFGFARLIVKPIEVLHAATRRLAKGDLSTRADIRTGDELQDLAYSFNAMAKGIEEARDRDEGVSRMKSEFLSIAAHQLRTPLSALKWVLNLALEGEVGELTKAQQDFLKKGYDANERMIALVNDLLDVVRIEEGRFDYKFEKGAVGKIIESIVKETKVIADQKEVQLSFHKPSRELPEIALDGVKFRLAVSNIIGNAVQYTPARGRVDIELTLNGDEILALVKDTGVGIPKHQISRVFTKFFRADNAVRMQPSGSGLGLFISKNIIEKHGGKVWIESEEGKGTTVYFTLPVAR